MNQQSVFRHALHCPQHQAFPPQRQRSPNNFSFANHNLEYETREAVKLAAVLYAEWEKKLQRPQWPESGFLQQQMAPSSSGCCVNKKPEMQHTALLKTRICHRFESGCCPHPAELCCFAHGAEDLRIPRNYRTKMCVNEARGHCPFGHKCHFIHVRGETSNRSPTSDYDFFESEPLDHQSEYRGTPDVRGSPDSGYGRRGSYSSGYSGVESSYSSGYSSIEGHSIEGLHGEWD